MEKGAGNEENAKDLGSGNPEKEPGVFLGGNYVEVTLTHEEDMVFTQLNMCFIRLVLNMSLNGKCTIEWRTDRDQNTDVVKDLGNSYLSLYEKLSKSRNILG